jgi:transcriptional regulator with XRE-family HTH domain
MTQSDAATTTPTSTAASPQAEPTKSADRTISSITTDYGLLRDETLVLNERVGEGHRVAQILTLDQCAQQRAREDVPRLLTELSDERGLGWSDIARLIGVSVQTLRNWRKGDPATGENRLAVARLAAFLDLLEDSAHVHDPASWLEIPVVEGYRPRYLDLYRAGRPELLFDIAGLRISPEQALDDLDPSWRESTRLVNEVFRADDGELSIRRRQ